MDLFSLTCTTCKSRLKVRDPGVIGQILACPKCGGMVMVKAPEGWQPGMALSAAPPSQTPGNTAVIERGDPDETHIESHFDAVDELLSDAPPKVKRPSAAAAAEAPALAKQRFVGAPLVAPPRNNGAATAVADSPAPAAKEEAGAANDLDAAPDFSPARPRSYWLLLSGSVAGGIALTVAVVLAINVWRDDANATAIASGTPSNPAPVDPSQPPATSTPATPGNVTPPAGSPLTPPGPAPNAVVLPPPVDPGSEPVNPAPPVDPAPPPMPMPEPETAPAPSTAAASATTEPTPGTDDQTGGRFGLFSRS